MVAYSVNYGVKKPFPGIATITCPLKDKNGKSNASMYKVEIERREHRKQKLKLWSGAQLPAMKLLCCEEWGE